MQRVAALLGFLLAVSTSVSQVNNSGCLRKGTQLWFFAIIYSVVIIYRALIVGRDFTVRPSMYSICNVCHSCLRSALSAFWTVELFELKSLVCVCSSAWAFSTKKVFFYNKINIFICEDSWNWIVIKFFTAVCIIGITLVNVSQVCVNTKTILNHIVHKIIVINCPESEIC